MIENKLWHYGKGTYLAWEKWPENCKNLQVHRLGSTDRMVNWQLTVNVRKEYLHEQTRQFPCGLSTLLTDWLSACPTCWWPNVNPLTDWLTEWKKDWLIVSLLEEELTYRRNVARADTDERRSRKDLSLRRIRAGQMCPRRCDQMDRSSSKWTDWLTDWQTDWQTCLTSQRMVFSSSEYLANLRTLLRGSSFAKS